MINEKKYYVKALQYDYIFEFKEKIKIKKRPNNQKLLLNSI